METLDGFIDGYSRFQTFAVLLITGIWKKQYELPGSMNSINKAVQIVWFRE